MLNDYLKSPRDVRLELAGRAKAERLRQNLTQEALAHAAAAAVLVMKAAKVEKGSGEPNRTKVGSITMQQVEEIAKLKLPDLNANGMEAAVKSIMGTARSMGIEIK